MIRSDIVIATVNFLGKRDKGVQRANQLAAVLQNNHPKAKHWFIAIEEARDVEENNLWELGRGHLSLKKACIQIFASSVPVILCEKEFGAVLRWEGHTVALVHLSSSPDNAISRQVQQNNLLYCESPVDIIMGDFNYHFNDEGIIKGMVDVWAAEHDIRSEPGYTYDYKTNQLCEYTVRKRIDRIYVRTELYHRGKSQTLYNNLLISDHYPVTWEPGSIDSDSDIVDISAKSEAMNL